MKIYQVGPDVLSDWDIEELGGNDRFEWLVHWYLSGSYEGEGEAVALSKDGETLYVKNLGHCSCYGPMDGGMESGDKMTVEKFLEVKENVLDYDCRKEIKDKVFELLQR